jgi:hypothetical protein
VTDRTNNDLAALLTPAPSKGVQFGQGKILTWERGGELRNTIEWRGITLTDIPMVEGINALSLKPGDIVGMLGWAPENAKGVGTWWILGKLSNPGEFVADLTFYLGQVRFLTKNNQYDQVYIGSDTNGLPMTVFYYGDSASTRALQIVGTNLISIRDPSGKEIFANDAATLHGIGRPYFNYLMNPAFSTDVVTTGPFWPSQDSTTYEDAWRGLNTVWHPVVSYGILAVSTGGAAEWRILVNGAQVVAGSGSASGTFNIPGWGTTITPDDLVTFTVQSRNSGGRTWVSVDRFYGRQT